METESSTEGGGAGLYKAGGPRSLRQRCSRVVKRARPQRIPRWRAANGSRAAATGRLLHAMPAHASGAAVGRAQNFLAGCLLAGPAVVGAASALPPAARRRTGRAADQGSRCRLRTRPAPAAATAPGGLSISGISCGDACAHIDLSARLPGRVRGSSSIGLNHPRRAP